MQKKKSIGMIVAVEIDAVLNRYGSLLKEIDEAGYSIRMLEADGYTMYILKCGPGEIAAAAGTQFLITRYNVELVVNFGVVGGLTREMSLARTVVVESVVHYDFDISTIDDYEVGRYPEYPSVYIPTTPWLIDLAIKAVPQLKRVVCASADKFVAGSYNKTALHQSYGADICEMEAAGILLTCNRNDVPCLMIKSVSDGLEGGGEEFYAQVNRSAAICLGATHKIIERM